MSKFSNEDVVLGNPPLKRSLVESFQEMIEKAVDCVLNDEQKKLFEKNLIDEWQKSKQSQEAILSSQKMFYEIKQQIRDLPEEKRSFAWQEFGRQLYVYAQTEGKNDPLGQLVINLYDAKQNILVKGNPPLSQQIAESYVEMSAFVYGLANQKQINLTPKQKEDMISELVKNFSSYSSQTQEEISQANALWGQLRYNWKHANKEEQETFRGELLKYISSDKAQQPTEKAEATESEILKESEETSLETFGKESEDEKVSLETNSEPKVIPPKFLSVVQQLRAKAIKSPLFSPQRKPK
jgi:hypothetical protein